MKQFNRSATGGLGHQRPQARSVTFGKVAMLVGPLALVWGLACGDELDHQRNATGAEGVVIYTSLDKVFSQPVLTQFERETGVSVKAVYDSEATKTTGLVNRLIAEKDQPQADVFWNSETGRTIVLKRKGVLAPYKSPSAADSPACATVQLCAATPDWEVSRNNRYGYSYEYWCSIHDNFEDGNTYRAV